MTSEVVDLFSLNQLVVQQMEELSCLGLLRESDPHWYVFRFILEGLKCPIVHENMDVLQHPGSEGFVSLSHVESVFL